jgi:CheY-like chemotaxis protein
MKLILLVDDDLDVLRSEVRLLRQMRPDDAVVCAVDGLSAWELLNRAAYNDAASHAPLALPVDLVISDWEMPRMDGHELSQHVRDRFKKLPFVLMSGNHSGLRSLADCYGPSALMEKPFTREGLQTILTLWLDGSAP